MFTISNKKKPFYLIKLFHRLTRAHPIARFQLANATSKGLPVYPTDINPFPLKRSHHACNNHHIHTYALRLNTAQWRSFNHCCKNPFAAQNHANQNGQLRPCFRSPLFLKRAVSAHHSHLNIVNVCVRVCMLQACVACALVGNRANTRAYK